MSAVVSGLWGTAVGVAPPTAFFCGALMLFGARLASGCTRCYILCFYIIIIIIIIVIIVIIIISFCMYVYIHRRK